MIIFGYLVDHRKATDPQEMLWCNTIHGNRHQRIISLEKVISEDGITACVLCAGKHKITWSKLPLKRNKLS